MVDEYMNGRVTAAFAILTQKAKTKEFLNVDGVNEVLVAVGLPTVEKKKELSLIGG